MATLKSITLAVLLAVPSIVVGQSRTTEALQKKYSESLGLFFYNNTLRMLNQTEDREFDELIRNIEKMRFLMIRKAESKFDKNDYSRLIASYKAEAFEEIMTSRHEGKNFNVYLKEQNGDTKGMLVLINDTESLYILDILGRIALDKVTKLYTKLDESTDIGSRIKDFTTGDREEKNEDQDK